MRHAAKRIARDARRQCIEDILVGAMVVCWASAVVMALVSLVATIMASLK